MIPLQGSHAKFKNRAEMNWQRQAAGYLYLHGALHMVVNPHPIQVQFIRVGTLVVERFTCTLPMNKIPELMSRHLAFIIQGELGEQNC